MKRVRAHHIIISVAAAVVIACIVFALFGPRAAGGDLLQNMGINFGHPMRPPAIAKGVDFNWLGNWDRNPQWNAVLARRFPAGSDEAALRSTLQQEGFHVEAATADYEWGGMPCLYTLRVNWSAANAKIKSVGGGFAMGCL